MRKQTTHKSNYNKIIMALIMITLIFTSMPITAQAATVKKPAQVTSLKATATGTSKIKLTWAKTKNATGYQIYMKSSKNGTYKKIKTIKSAKTVAYTKTNLKSNTKYWFKIRAYKTSGKKTVYGKFSAVKSATTKHSHTWVNHTTKVKKTRDVIVREWDEQVQIGTEPIYETKWQCPICTEYFDSAMSAGRHITDNHADYISENGDVTITKTEVQTGEKPIYETQHKVEYGKETYYVTVTDYKYCKTCKARK